MKNKILLFLITLPSVLLAQTGGPGQPEFMQFKPVTATDLVNVSTGTFSYNIPLFEIGGYPCNLSYQSGPQMDDVASMVGLGWNLNIGAISHTMRGIPDDFNGDPIVRNIYMKPNITMGGNIDLGIEMAGIEATPSTPSTTNFIDVGVNMGIGMIYNSLNGFALERSCGLNFSVANHSKTKSAGIGLGMKTNSMNGVDVYAQPNASLTEDRTQKMSNSGSLGGCVSVNSREGIKGSINASMSQSANANYNVGALNSAGVREASGKDKTMSETFSSFSATYSFSKTPEIPRVSYPFTTKAFTGSFKVGGEIYFLHPELTLKGYYTRQDLTSNIISTPAYGFLYAENSLAAGENVLLDFSREKDQPYVKDVSINIGIPSYTNDIYSVNAQGISGSFQLNRNDIGVIFDNQIVSASTATDVGVEWGVGNATHIGADISTAFTSSSCGKWSSVLTPNLNFKSANLNNLFQPAYFKNASDVNVDENGFYARLDYDRAIKVNLEKTGFLSVGMKPSFSNNSDQIIDASSPIFKQERDPRTINIQYLTAVEATNFGLNKLIDVYSVNNFDCSSPGFKAAINRVTTEKKGHHISEITATNIDGMRYVFGLPVYNLKQDEISYTLEGNEFVDTNGLVAYDPNIVKGQNGKDGFYEQTTTPAYVTTNLLTAVLSPDYIDVDEDGPSMNDVGNYVKFNYSKSGDFTWRTPYQANKATFNKSFLSDPLDNKATVVYGTKELYYIHSIESKTEIAEFYYDINRLDGYGAGNQQKLYRLKEIKVFSKNERILKGINAIAIRIIKFTQDYSLCPGTNNSMAPNHGKLTLKEVAMYSGKSMRELKSPYKFTYGEITPGIVVNPSYNTRNLNRWGNYQENNNKNINNPTTDLNTSPLLSNVDFPYASQDEKKMTRAAYAWNLTKILLPSGGTIQTVYEPHRYAYTQNERNMEMFTIEGFGNSISDLTGSTLYSQGFGNSNRFLKIKLKKPILTSDPILAKQQLLYQYFNTVSMSSEGLPQDFYYKTLMELRADRSSTWEWVSGYCKINGVGLLNANEAYIELEDVCIPDKNKNDCERINPIAKNAFQFMRMNRSGLCYGTMEQAPLSEDVTLEDFLNTQDLSSEVADQKAAFRQGFNFYAKERNLANNVALKKSFIRLYSPDQNKIIGGSRVKTIVTNDNWKSMTLAYGTPTPESKKYTIDYEYSETIKNPVTNGDSVISSGVVEYEPANGGDENPLHLPSYYEQHIKMAPDNNLFVELPYNESLYPGTNLIYSKVKVISNKTLENIPGTGYQVSEFFTAKDYPVQSDHTEIGENWEMKTSMLQGMLTSMLGVSEFHDFVTLSQGFSVILNDMHGKTKCTKNYNSQGTLVSSEEFEYGLAKNLQLMNGMGKLTTSDKLGVSVSAICDSRNTEHETALIGVDLNFDFTIVAVVPTLLFVPMPKYSIENTRLNTVCFNKIVTKKGIQTKKTVTENGARVSTENLWFDEKTGNPVLTRTTNEFNDYIYSFHYPANWIYSGLSAGYVASDLVLQLSSVNATTHTISTNSQIFGSLNLGDELVNLNTFEKFWITGMSVGNTITFHPRIVGGTISPGNYKLLHSGRKNMIKEEAGTVVTNYLPINSATQTLSFTANSGVINSSMKQYDDKRVIFCPCPSSVNTTNQNNNPYFLGTLGNWYPLRTWAYLTDRKRSTGVNPGQTNLRMDGVFTTYKNFFNPPNSSNNWRWTLNSTGWQWVETVTIKDVNGLTLETKDPLKRYNSMLTGYKQKLIVAEAGNAKQREIIFDGFEDVNYLPYTSMCDSSSLCQLHSIKWNGYVKVRNEEAHTGKFSSELLQSTSISIPLDIDPRCGLNRVQQTKLGNTPVRSKVSDTIITLDTSEDVCCTGIFRPDKNKKYIISAWVKERGNELAYTYTDPEIIAGGTSFKTSGNIIDGWQRIQGEFMMPSGATLDIRLNKGAQQTYIDDIRIYPVDAKMTTYVYDRNTQKLTFTCDENNYFTKYNYDAANNLQSINKETEQGVQTIKEGRSSTQINP